MLALMQHLSSLTLSKCTLADSLDYLRQLLPLTSLDIGGSSFRSAEQPHTPHALTSLAHMTNLRQLSLPNTVINPATLSAIAQLHASLQALNIAGCDGVGCQDLALLVALTQLTQLQLSLFHLTHSQPWQDEHIVAGLIPHISAYV